VSNIEVFEEEEYSDRINNRTLLRIGSLLLPHKRTVIAFLATIILVSIGDSVFTYLIKQIIDVGIASHDMGIVLHLLGLYAGLGLLQACFVFGFIYMVGILGERIRYDLRKNMFNHLQDLSLSYFSQKPVGWIMARVTSDSDRVAQLMTWGLLDVTWAVVNILTASIFMLTINWRLALVVYAMIPVLLFIGINFRKRILTEYRNVRKFNSKITASFNETITGVRVVKALCREEENLAEFSHLTKDMYSSSYRAAWLSALFLPMVQMISAFALGLVVWLGGWQVQIGAMTIGGIQAFVSYITFMMWPIQDMARVFADMQHAIASAERMFSLIDSQPDIADRPNSAEITSLRGDILFEHVDFSYDDGKAILKDFSLEVKPGEAIALVGPTGGGKTTLVNLLCRFYEPSAGRILINHIDYTQIKMSDIQSRIGVVLQTPHLFSGTIRENIRYGRLNATDEEVQTASRVAGAHEFIMALEKGYAQEVGEGGIMLSVGQKQLISIARAILSEPEIFIMDEATSSVDTRTEALIQKGMEALIAGKTSFIIAHRLSTIKRADKIVLVDDGRIVEAGTHAELLKLGGHYYRLYTRQFRQQMHEAYDPLFLTDTLQQPTDEPA
jgi:ATP-binding cassette, subfamily B, bacterial